MANVNRGIPAITYGMIILTTFILSCITLYDGNNKTEHTNAPTSIDGGGGENTDIETLLLPKQQQTQQPVQPTSALQQPKGNKKTTIKRHHNKSVRFV